MDHYKIFRECFPSLPLDRKSFYELAQINDCLIFEENGGFAAVRKNELRLLCVPPHIRGKGIGTKLLRRAEEHIFNAGYDEAAAGGFSSRLFIGVPVSREEFMGFSINRDTSKASSIGSVRCKASDRSNTCCLTRSDNEADDRTNRGFAVKEVYRGSLMKNGCVFFEKNGYACSGGAAEMKPELDGFSADSFDITVPENAYFGEYKGPLSDLIEAVDKVEPEWTQYFNGANVFCGYLDGEIASFCMTDDDECCLLSGGKGKTGSVGCVGTVPEYRRRGIGLKMVALAAKGLKEKGCARCFIHYTGVYDWYAKIGAETFLWELFYKKARISA